MTFEEIADRILSKLPGMSAELAKGAKYVIDNPDDAALLSMRQLAARAQVTPVTLVRLAQRLELGEWQSLREVFADRLRTAPTRYSERADAVLHRGKTDRLIAETGHAQDANLAYALAANKQEAILEAAAVMQQAPRIIVAGFRSCRPVAMALAYLCRMLHPSVSVIGADGGSLEAELADLTKEDVVAVVTFSYYSREIGLVVDAVKRHNATMIAIVDSAAAPPVAASRVVLQFSVDSPSFFPSIVGAIAIVETLAVAMLAKGGKSAATRVKRVESELIELGAYINVPGK